MDKFVLVCGIGGSGTSVTCSVLNELGYSFGNYNKQKGKKKITGREGYFENLALEKAIKLWNLCESTGWRFAIIDYIPKINSFKTINIFKISLYKHADKVLLKEFKQNMNQKLFAIKRPSSFWWIWRITLLAKKAKIPRPKIIFCDREDTQLGHSRFEGTGTNYIHTLDYANKCRFQYKYLSSNNRKISPDITKINFEDYKLNPQKIAKNLSTLLDIDEIKIIKAIKKVYKP